MSVVGYAQRQMYSDSTKADFTWNYRKYDVFTGWVFEAKTENPLASKFDNIVVDFAKFRQADDIYYAGAKSLSFSALAIGACMLNQLI